MDNVVNLRRPWILGEQIGRGGFGRVFVATALDGITGVAKLVPKEPGADRELLFTDLTGVRNVVPIIDHGETDTAWVLVMPRADRSMRDLLDAAGGPLPVADALQVLEDVADALEDLDNRVVHRDLKPENVLLLHGKCASRILGSRATPRPRPRRTPESSPSHLPTPRLSVGGWSARRSPSTSTPSA